MGTRRQLVGIFFLFAFSIFISGCEMPTSLARTSVWLDVPVHGISVPEGQVLQIEGHASSPGGVNMVEIWINGGLHFEVSNLVSVNDHSRFSQEWLPPGPGEYTIQVLAISGDGSASEADHARIQVGEPVAEVQPDPEQVPPPQQAAPDTTTSILDPISPTDVVIEFWADPGEISAGDLFTVHWHVENVSKVIFGGIEQLFDGTYSDYLCKNQRYTLTVIHNDGTEEKRRVSSEE